MPLGSLLITLSSDRARASLALRQLRRRPQFQLGQRHGRCLPAVLTTADHHQSTRDIQWLKELPGIVHVEVLFVHFDHTQRASAAAPRPNASPDRPRRSDHDRSSFVH